MRETAASSNWCADFFSDTFAEVHLVRRDPAQLAQVVSFLAGVLALRPGMHVFDQCCGVGDVSLALAKAGYDVTGVDLMPSYVERARARARAAGLPARFMVGDARATAPGAPCDAAFNWWTSFGYFDDDAENRAMLLRVFESLKPGGRFALDYMNSPARRAAFAAKPRLVDEYTLPDGGCSVWESRLDAAGRMLVRRWRYTDAAGLTVSQEGAGARLYSPAELQALLESAGFARVRFYGSDAGAPLAADSPRCIAVAVKPEKEGGE